MLHVFYPSMIADFIAVDAHGLTLEGATRALLVVMWLFGKFLAVHLRELNFALKVR